MVQAPRELILPSGVRENAAIVFKLVYQKSVTRGLQWPVNRHQNWQQVCVRIHRQQEVQNAGALGRRQGWLAGTTRDRRGAQCSQSIQDGRLVITGKRSVVRTEPSCIEQQRDGVLGVLAVVFERHEYEGLALDPGETKRRTPLLAAEGVLGRSCEAVGQRRIKSLPRLQRLRESGRVPRIEDIIAEEAINAAMDV